MSKGRAKAMRMCPENCIFRNHEARFCGYCLIDIMDDLKTKVTEKLNDIDLNQKKRDFQHLVFYPSHADRILHFKSVIDSL